MAEHLCAQYASRWLLRACTIELSQQSAVHGGDNATSHDDGLGCDGTFSTGNGTAQNCAWLPAMLFDCAAKGHNPAAATALVRWLRVAAQTLMAGAATDDVTIVEQFVLAPFHSSLSHRAKIARSRRSSCYGHLKIAQTLSEIVTPTATEAPA